MNKSAVFWLEFFSKRFAPGPSSVELQSTLETLIAMFAYAVKEKKNWYCARSASGLEETKVGVQATRMTGAKLKNKAHLQVLLLHVLPAGNNSANYSVVNRVTSCDKTFCDRETRQVLLYATKVLAKMLS